MLQQAIEIATKAHAGQPYIGHPLRVMAMGTTEEEEIVGLLHDVAEDSDCSFERLAYISEKKVKRLRKYLKA